MTNVRTLRLERGQDVIAGLCEYLKDKPWNAALIVSGIGSVSSATIGNPMTHDLPPKMYLSKIDEPAEVLAFTGEIIRKENAPDDFPAHTKEYPSEYAIHIHIAIAHSKGTVTGGGFRDARVMRALNIYMVELD